MDRRSFLTKAALGGTAAAASTLAAPAYAQGNRTLTMVTTWGRGLAGVFDAAQHVADSITSMSDGSLNIEIKASGELVGALEVFDAVSSGQADMYHGADYYFVGQHPAYAFFTAVPFGMSAQELANWYYHGGGQEYHDKLGEVFNLKSFLAGNTGAQAGGWFHNEMNSPEDFKGLKFRMPGLGGQALGKLGASVQNLPGSEVYQALASGAIDGTEWIGPWADEVAGFQEITKIYYTAGFHEPGAGLTLATNREVFDELSPAHQKIIEIAAAEAHQWNLAQFLNNNGAALQRLISEGVQVREFNDSIWDAFGAASEEVLDGYMDDALFAEIRASVSASMAASSDWIQKSEGAYRAQRDRVRG
ncbi:MAG: TRAP transporter substrate-binding protein [Rhodobacteraceae bacterium]|nr:TRAP transporter substrate-binding protein [Paracoccaceae bacterium]